MSAVQELSDTWNYDPYAHDRAAWWDHHRALVQAMEPAQWPSGPTGEIGLHIHWTEAEIIEIRTQYAAGNIYQHEIAAAFGCSETTVRNITTGRTHRNVGGPITPSQPQRKYLA